MPPVERSGTGSTDGVYGIEVFEARRQRTREALAPPTYVGSCTPYTGTPYTPRRGSQSPTGGRPLSRVRQVVEWRLFLQEARQG